MEKYIFRSKEETVAALAGKLASLIESEEGRVNIALSGGSTPEELFFYLADNYRNSIPWERVRFFWVDERCVPPDHRESNYAMTARSLLDRVPVREENIFRMRGEAIPHEEARRYSQLLDSEIPRIGGKPAFHIILLGMGDDGHTASIFPDRPDLLESMENCAAARHPSSGQWRISLAGPVINNGSNIIFLIAGESKRDVLKKVLVREKKFPASHIAPRRGNLYFYLDSAAAG